MAYISKSDIAALTEIYDCLKMETCSFSDPTSGIDSTQFIRDKTRLWRETWLMEPLKRIIDKLENE